MGISCYVCNETLYDGHMGVAQKFRDKPYISVHITHPYSHDLYAHVSCLIYESIEILRKESSL